MNGCRLFGVFAADPKRREDFAEEAIKACLVVLAFCDESATVCSAACDCLYNYCYRCEFAALLAAEQGAYEKVQEAVGNFMSDEHPETRKAKVLAPSVGGGGGNLFLFLGPRGLSWATSSSEEARRAVRGPAPGSTSGRVCAFFSWA